MLANSEEGFAMDSEVLTLIQNALTEARDCAVKLAALERTLKDFPDVWTRYQEEIKHVSEQNPPERVARGFEEIRKRLGVRQ